MTTIRRLFTACCLVFIAVGLVACEEQGPVGSEVQEEQAEQEKDVHKERLESFGLPTNFAEGIHAIGNRGDTNRGQAKLEGTQELETVSDPLQPENEVQSRSPSDYTVSSTPEAYASVQDTYTGESALPPSSVETTSLSKVSSTSTITQETSVQASEGTKSLSKNGSTIEVYLGSYIYPWFYERKQMGSYTYTSEAIDYLETFGASYINFIPRYQGFDYGYDTAYTGVGALFDVSGFSGFTYYYQNGSHYGLEEGPYKDRDFSASSYAYTVEYE